MDQDTTRGKYAHQKILNDFEEGRTDILVGTQMISKGLDFGRLSLVGVLNADNMIHFPDFRSQERSFQMLLQVSGRAGRRDQQGKVIIQTYNPHHNLINFVKNNDYFSLYSMLLPERQKYKYPPFYRLVIIRLKHRDHKVLSREASRLAELLRPHFPQKLLGPEYPLVARIKNFYIKQILLKLERGSQVDKQKVKIKEIIEAFDKKAIKAGRVRISIDVDPS
jgi:primosomal protein N' (replication factor Y)